MCLKQNVFFRLAFDSEEGIKFRQFGFDNLVNFLKSLSDVFVFRENANSTTYFKSLCDRTVVSRLAQIDEEQLKIDRQHNKYLSAPTPLNSNGKKQNLELMPYKIFDKPIVRKDRSNVVWWTDGKDSDCKTKIKDDAALKSTDFVIPSRCEVGD